MDRGIYVLVGIVILAILVISGLYLLLKKAHKWGFNNVKKNKVSNITRSKKILSPKLSP